MLTIIKNTISPWYTYGCYSSISKTTSDKILSVGHLKLYEIGNSFGKVSFYFDLYMYVCLFACRFSSLLRIFHSCIPWRHHCRSRAANFIFVRHLWPLSSTGFFAVCHTHCDKGQMLLGHPRGPLNFKPVAECLTLELSLYTCLTA